MDHMSNLKAIVDDYTSTHGSSDSWVSEQMGMTRQTLSAWWNRGLTTMPDPYQLHALARVTRTPYRDVLDAALTDFSYLPESAAANSKPSRRMLRGKGQMDRFDDDYPDDVNQDPGGIQ